MFSTKAVASNIFALYLVDFRNLEPTIRADHISILQQGKVLLIPGKESQKYVAFIVLLHNLVETSTVWTLLNCGETVPGLSLVEYKQSQKPIWGFFKVSL